MWLTFAIEVLFLVAIFYLPAVYLFRVSGVDRIRSIAFAPVLTGTSYYLLAYFYVIIGLQANWFMVVAPICIAFLLGGFIVHRIMHGDDSASPGDIAFPVLYLIVGVIIAGALYVLPLDGPDSVVQLFDNAHHLYLTESFISSGDFAPRSLLSYPSMWHSIAALAADFGQSNVALSVNALNFVILAVVLPLGLLGYLKTLWPSGHNRLLLCGAITPLLSLSFPWDLISFGPLFPLIFSNSLILIAGSAFISLIRRPIVTLRFWFNLIFFAICCLCLLFAHPSSIFASIVIFLPALLWYVWQKFECVNKPLLGFFATFGILGLTIAFWLACYGAPFFSGVVNFNWEPWGSFANAVHNLLVADLSGFGVLQISLTVFALFGCLWLIFRIRESRWIVISLILAASLYIASVCLSGDIRKILTGFWYTDSYRLAALFAIAEMPLLACGVDGLATTAITAFRKICEMCKIGDRACVMHSSSQIIYIPIACVALFSTLFTPSNLPGNESYTPYSLIGERLSWCNRLDINNAPLDVDEKQFLKKVSEVVGTDRVMNFPFDGSVFGSHLFGINLVVPTMSLQTPYDSDALAFALTSGDKGALSRDVVDAFSALDCKYVLLLDYGRMNKVDTANSVGGGFYYVNYDPDMWRGLTAITDDAGFDVILSEGDMRLLRIG